MKKEAITYQKAGVDIQKLDRFKKNIIKPIHKTFGPEVLSKIGGFGGLFALNKAVYRSPVLVSSVDGVGTKLKVAVMMNKHNTVGIDIVSHCANDIVVQGAKPIFFLDYIGSGQLETSVGAQIIEGLVKGCLLAKCALIGGETAEMPGMYQEDDYDLVGTIVGLVDKKRIIDGSKVKKGDAVLGLASNGLHTNGYSLARKVFFEKMNWSVHQKISELETSIGEALLKPHTCYCEAILRTYEKIDIHAISHITGGGFEGNIPRVLPKHCKVVIRRNCWKILPIFKLIQNLGEVPEPDMYRTFNMGLGMVVILSGKDVPRAQKLFRNSGIETYLIGEVVPGQAGVEFKN